ncbi:MAG: hypothetical protein WBO46_06235 [Caldilineaceae bacterium]
MSQLFNHLMHRANPTRPLAARSASVYDFAVWGYVLLLIFVFPFICWGQNGRADHPHPHAHFVFAPPFAIEPDTLAAGPAVVDHSQHRSPGFVDDPAGSFPIDDVAGQSLPATLALFSLLLILVGYHWLLYRSFRQSQRIISPLGAAQAVPEPPFSPPRFS